MSRSTSQEVTRVQRGDDAAFNQFGQTAAEQRCNQCAVRKALFAVSRDRSDNIPETVCHVLARQPFIQLAVKIAAFIVRAIAELILAHVCQDPLLASLFTRAIARRSRSDRTFDCVVRKRGISTTGAAAPRWQEAGGSWLRANGLPQSILTTEYDDHPRGRIVFDQNLDQFILYADRRLQTPNCLNAIKSRFNLLAARTTIRSDQHYR